MELSVRDLSETVAELTIKVEAATVSKEFSKHYAELQKSLELPGFRKGKVPHSVLKRRFGKELQSEIARELAGNVLEEALGQARLRPVGEPVVESFHVEEGEPFRMVVRLEHLPELRLTRYKGLAPPGAELEASEDELQKQLRALQLREAKRTDVERPAQRGDHVEGRFLLYVNGELEGSSGTEPDKKLELVIGEDTLFTGTRLDEKIVGHQKGERFRIEGETPLAYPIERYRGRQVALEVELDKVQELDVPELTDEYVQEHLHKSLEELREEMRRFVLDKKQKEERDRRLEAVFERLRQENPFSVPEVLLRLEVSREEEQWDKYKVPESERQELRRTQGPRVERKVRNALLLQKVIELEHLEATDADLKKRYEVMAPFFGNSPEGVQQLYQSQPRLQDSLRNDILENKALDFLLESTSSLIVEV